MRVFRQFYKKIEERRRSHHSFSPQEMNIINEIKKHTEKSNVDNISRTQAYAAFFERNKEIKWSFLASMVSRNAGWNMTDLEGIWFPKSLSKNYRHTLFLTYERANWLIFSDAYPQLLLYEFSKKNNQPYFHLLKVFLSSTFIETEWELFLKLRDENRLMTAQIINEQNLIQKPVMEHPFYKEKVFKSFIYMFQDFFHFSSVLFPTKEGDLYGFSVHHFRNATKRIELGKRLAWLLFHPEYYPSFYCFSKSTEHTGSRYDYEQFVNPKKIRDTPFLRTTFPIIEHKREVTVDWFNDDLSKVKSSWYKEVKKQDKINITNWYKHKQKQLRVGIAIENLLTD